MERHETLILVFLVQDLLTILNLLQTDVNLIHGIEAEVGKKMEKYECEEITDSLEVTKVNFCCNNITVLVS